MMDNPHEIDLYRPFIKYLRSQDWGLYAFRIDDHKSKKRKETSNRWLHPDIVAVEIISENYDFNVEYNYNGNHVRKNAQDIIKSCFIATNSPQIKMYSFELKVSIDYENYRKYFFQALSNSSWANEAYLVATSVQQNIRKELKLLSEKYGVGVIVFDNNAPQKSFILFQARKSEIDWPEAMRLAKINPDFTKFLDNVNIFIQNNSSNRITTSFTNNLIDAL